MFWIEKNSNKLNLEEKERNSKVNRAIALLIVSALLISFLVLIAKIIFRF